MMSHKNRLIIILFLLALASGFFWNQKIFGTKITGDEEIYNRAAQSLVFGVGFPTEGEESTLEPLYPVFLASTFNIFGSGPLAVQLIQIFIFALLPVMVLLIAENCGLNWLAAFLAGLATALFYALATEAGKLHKEILLTFILLLSLLDLQVYLRSNKLFNLITASILIALAAQISATIIILPVFLTVGLWINCLSKNRSKYGLKFSIIFLIIFVAVFYLVGFWKNQLTTTSKQIFVPRAGFALAAKAELMAKLAKDYPAHLLGHVFGYYFVLKINSQIDPNAFREVDDTKKEFYANLKNQRNIREVDKQLLTKAKNAFFANPQWYAGMFLLDWISFNSPLLPTRSDWSSETTIHQMFSLGGHNNFSVLEKIVILLTIRLVWYFFLGMVVYGLIVKRREWPSFVLVVAMLVYFNLFFSAVRAIPRYALPIYPLYFLLATTGFLTLFGQCCNLVEKYKPQIKETL